MPIFSRYTAVLLAAAADGFEPLGSHGVSHPKRVLAGATAVIVLIGLTAPALALILFVSALAAALLVRWVTFRLFSSVPQASMGALVEITELAMLWAPVIVSAAGVNLALLRLGL